MASPHGRTYYSAFACIALAAATVFAWGVFQTETAPAAVRWFGGGLVAVFLLCALQALERLVRPDKAARRSNAFSASASRKIRIACQSIGAAATAASVISILTPRTVSGGLPILPGVLLFIAACLADLAGERLLDVYRRGWAA
jgi:hypothetical protein